MYTYNVGLAFVEVYFSPLLTAFQWPQQGQFISVMTLSGLSPRSPFDSRSIWLLSPKSILRGVRANLE